MKLFYVCLSSFALLTSCRDAEYLYDSRILSVVGQTWYVNEWSVEGIKSEIDLSAAFSANERIVYAAFVDLGHVRMVTEQYETGVGDWRYRLYSFDLHMKCLELLYVAPVDWGQPRASAVTGDLFAVSWSATPGAIRVVDLVQKKEHAIHVPEPEATIGAIKLSADGDRVLVGYTLHEESLYAVLDAGQDSLLIEGDGELLASGWGSDAFVVSNQAGYWVIDPDTGVKKSLYFPELKDYQIYGAYGRPDGAWILLLRDERPAIVENFLFSSKNTYKRYAYGLFLYQGGATFDGTRLASRVSSFGNREIRDFLNCKR